MMTTALLAALSLGAAAVIAAVTIWRSQRAQRGWLAAAQFIVAALLYLVLFPPSTRGPYASGEMVVLTPGIDDAQRAKLSRAATVVALPGVNAAAAIERVPDLGTALRRHPDSAARIAVVGGGLPARDRDAARGRVARFDAAALPRGFVELIGPDDVRAGQRFRVEGRVEDARGGRVELRDPAAAVVASAPLDEQGRFVVEGVAKAAGNALFTLRALDGTGAGIDDVVLPVAARAGDALKLLVLGGAPDAELKYLRRWAVDAGVALDSRITLSPGIALTEGIGPASARALDAASLRALDIVIVDERAWMSLDAASKSALDAAVLGGLGLMLRVTGPLDAAVAADFAKFGFSLSASATAPAPVSLTSTLGLGENATTFNQAAVAVSADDGAVLLHADDGRVLASWRAAGAGRVAVWSLADSYRLVLAGRADAFGSLWSDRLATLARARAAVVPNVPIDARVGERASLCGVGSDARVVDDANASTELLPVPNRFGESCAAYWPPQAGWQTLIASGDHMSFYARAADTTSALARGDAARATRALLTSLAATDDGALSLRAMALPRWPFFIAWLAATTLLWIGERRRARTAAID